MKRLKSIVLIILSVCSVSFSDFPNRHSLEFSLLGYRFSYSEEFEKPKGLVIGFPRSDEYGFTAGGEAGYKYYNARNKLSFGAKINYSRSVDHTYDGSFQGKHYYISAEDPPSKPEYFLIYEPVKIYNKDNYFYCANLKIGYLIIAASNVNFEVNAAASGNGWLRPIDVETSEKYYWARIYPGTSLSTRNRQDLGIASDLSFSIPVWQKMYLPADENTKYKFDIGAKIGWKFEFGLIRYLAANKAWKVSYFYEYYGFKQSPYIPVDDNYVIYEPSSSTKNNGVKVSFETGLGGK